MRSENATLNTEELDDFDENLLSLDEMGKVEEEQLDFEISEFDFLKNEQEKIGSPEALGDTIKEVIFEQVINQIGTVAGEDFIKENGGLTLDLRNEAHIQTAENFENGKIATHNYISRENLEKNYDRYKNVSHRDFRKDYVDPGMDKVLKRAGDLNKEGIDTVTDIYTGRQIPTKTKLENGKNNNKAAQREHVKSSAEIYNSASLQMANDNEGLAGIINDPENLQGYTTAERNNRKSDNSADNMEDRDKTKHWEKSNEKAEKFIKKKEEEGENQLKEEGRKTQKAEAFRMGGKALRTAIVTLLAELLKNIISKLVKWFKTAKRTFMTLVEYIKEAINSFLSKIKTHIVNAGNAVITTIASSIYGPIVGIFKKLWMILKQGWKSLKEAFNYIKNPENRKKSIGVLLLEIGKIVVAGLSATGAIILGEVIEKGLMSIPFLAIEIPLLGSLANIIGIFMGASISGIMGAIVINLIQKSIEKKLKKETIKKQIIKGNEILVIQNKIQKVNEKKLVYRKTQVTSDIGSRHEGLSKYIEEHELEIEVKNKILKNELEEYTKDKEKKLKEYIEKNSIVSSDEETENQAKREKKFDSINSLLNNLID